MAPKTTQGKIQGFFLGGTVPLASVGYVMAAMYEAEAGDLKVAPFAPEPIEKKPLNGLAHSPRLALPAPPEDGKRRIKTGSVKEMVYAFLIKYHDTDHHQSNVYAALHKKRDTVTTGSVAQALAQLVNDGRAERVTPGTYRLKRGDNATAVETPKASNFKREVSAPTLLLNLLRDLKEKKLTLVTAKETRDLLGEAGFARNGAGGLLKRSMKLGWIKKKTGVNGIYEIANLPEAQAAA